MEGTHFTSLLRFWRSFDAYYARMPDYNGKFAIRQNSEGIREIVVFHYCTRHRFFCNRRRCRTNRWCAINCRRGRSSKTDFRGTCAGK